MAAGVLALWGCGGEKQEKASPDGKADGSNPSDRGGGARPTELGAMTIGFSQLGAEGDWRTAETDSIRGEAQRLGVSLKFADGQSRQEKQISDVKAFILQDVDAIILAPIVETGWEPVLRDAKRANIPVFLVDRGVDVSDESLYVTLIASDFVEEGRLAADWMAYELGGKANIAELQGTVGAAPAIDRKRGFAEEIAKHEGMKIIASQSGDFRRSVGKEVMEGILAAHADELDAVFAHNDDMAMGAIEAIARHGLEPGVDIVVVSIDGVRAAFEAMVAGTLNCTVECNPLLGPKVFDAIRRHATGEELPKWIRVEDQVFDQTTAADVIGSRRY
ncbi:MAG: ABC transporter substrate-binding protein [Phycisphaeraceae bacterium]|nr:ABC transporter substrate-binding protein [Phycisphaeraceae bacterium]